MTDLWTGQELPCAGPLTHQQNCSRQYDSYNNNKRHGAIPRCSLQNQNPGGGTRPDPIPPKTWIPNPLTPWDAVQHTTNIQLKTQTELCPSLHVQVHPLGLVQLHSGRRNGSNLSPPPLDFCFNFTQVRGTRSNLTSPLGLLAQLRPGRRHWIKSDSTLWNFG